MKHYPEVKSFIHIVTFIILKKRLTSRVAVNFVDQNQILNFDKSLGYPTSEVQCSKILSWRIDFISLIHRMHLLVYIGQVSGRLNDIFFAGRCFIQP